MFEKQNANSFDLATYTQTLATLAHMSAENTAANIEC
jgi:hypothetical protein